METKKRLTGFEKIILMSEKLLTIFDVTELLDSLVVSVAELLDAQGATLYLVDTFEGKLISQSIRSDGIQDISLNIDERSIAGYTAISRRSLHIADAYADLSEIHPQLRFNKQIDGKFGGHTRNMITHPLIMHQELIGVFQVINKQEGDFSEEDQCILKDFSVLASIAIMNARLMEKVMETQTTSYNIIENISDLVIVLNRSGFILHVNKASMEYLRRKGRLAASAGLLYTEVFSEFANLSEEINKMVNQSLDRFVSNGKPSYIILSEKNLQKQIDKIILVIKKSDQ